MEQNFPDYTKSYNDRAQEFEKKGKYDEAIAIYREALDRYPDLAGLHNNLGCCLANKYEYQQAAEEFEKAIALTPINRQEGIVTPDSYPEEPMQNLRAVQGLDKGYLRTAPPARVRFGGRSVRRPDFYRPGMGFLSYLLLFLVTRLGGFLLFVAMLITLTLWYDRSPYTLIALGISCFVILVIALIAYSTDPRLRS